jgi:hypothetical protein
MKGLIENQTESLRGPNGALEVYSESAGEISRPSPHHSVSVCYSGGDRLIEGGYIILARKIFDTEHWVWQLPPTHFKFLIGIIFAARWDKTPADFTAPDGTILKIRRGQFACATRRLAQKMRLSHQVIRTCLKNMSNRGFLTHDTTHGVTVITLYNYDNYQNPELYNNTGYNTRLTHGQHTPNTLIKKGNKGKKENKKEMVHFPKEIKQTVKILEGLNVPLSNNLPFKILEYTETWLDIDPVKLAKRMVAYYEKYPDRKPKNVTLAVRNWFETEDKDEYRNCCRSYQGIDIID